MQLVELEVGPVAHGGWCVARGSAGDGADERVVFVRHALPGERVKARIVETTKRFLRADAVEVLAASPDRVEPPCPFAGPGRCGGCDWQHATPEAQRRLKAAVIEDQLRRIAGVERSVVVEELPGGSVGWRTRVQFAVRPDGVVGFHRHRSHDVEPVDACLIAHPEVERLGIEDRRWPGVQRIEASVSGTGDRLIRVAAHASRGHRERRPAVPRLEVPVRVVHGKPVPGPSLPYVREVAAGRTWRVSGGGFWQVHPAAPSTLVDAVLTGLAPREGETVVDLYCGAGLFAGALASAVGESGSVVGVEGDAIAVRDARYNLRDLPSVRIERGHVERVLDRLGLTTVELVVLDPPRAGAGREVVRRIAGLATRRIVYVSCDPATLARDTGYLLENGWALSGVRGFDTFPMTHHVESVAVFDPA